MPLTSSVQFTLYVPVDMPHSDAIHERVAEELGQLAGGWTEIRARGGWHGEYVHSYEDIVLYQVAVSESPAEPNRIGKAHATLRELALLVKREGEQENVYLTRQVLATELI